MAVEDTIGARKRDFRDVLEEAWSQPTPLLVPGREWDLTVTGGVPLVRVLIGEKRWLLLLQCAKWSRGRRAAAEMIASGDSVARELFIYQRRERRRLPSATLCRMVAWLPRKPAPDVARSRRAPQHREEKSKLRVWNQPIEHIDIINLRKAIHANWISFPSQAPIFPTCGRPDLQRKLVQLYFVLGWSTAKIANRYGLLRQQVQRILNSWKTQAVTAGYVQHIPPTDVIPNWRP